MWWCFCHFRVAVSVWSFSLVGTLCFCPHNDGESHKLTHTPSPPTHAATSSALFTFQSCYSWCAVSISFSFLLYPRRFGQPHWIPFDWRGVIRQRDADCALSLLVSNENVYSVIKCDWDSVMYERFFREEKKRLYILCLFHLSVDLNFRTLIAGFVQHFSAWNWPFPRLQLTTATETEQDGW